MRSRAWIFLDALMLLAVLLLQVWRFTGVPIHEWLSVVLIAVVVAHLLLHWNWVETRFRRLLQPGTLRTRINFGLNLVLFIAMAVAFASGFLISKVVLPMNPTPSNYLRFHGIHETSSRVALAAIGLHLALNWDVLFAARPRLRAFVRPVGWIAVSAILVVGGVYAIESVMPQPDITMIRDGKRIEHAAPPPDIAKLRRDQTKPNLKFWPPLVAQAVAVGVAALIGRKVLKLRLD